MPHRPKPRRRAPHQHERRQVGDEGEREERQEERAERATGCATAVGRHERRTLDPRAGDTARHEKCDRTRREQGGARQGSSGSVAAGGTVGGGAVVAGGGATGGVTGGVCLGGGCEAGGASGTESVGAGLVSVVSVVVAGGV